ncbi:hypothetical protein CNEO4_1190019 [Clostridium neonatale]|nr:hypothetical protein CNEO4_1190019 [Clostridium neonatale]
MFQELNSTQLQLTEFIKMQLKTRNNVQLTMEEEILIEFRNYSIASVFVSTNTIRFILYYHC